MVAITMASMFKIKSKDLAVTDGLMGESMKGIGMKGNSMVKVNLATPKGKANQACGIMVREFSGLKKEMTIIYTKHNLQTN